MNNSGTDTGTSYLQTSAVPGVDGRLITHNTCYNCGRKGHYANNCPGQNNSESSDQKHIQVRNKNNVGHMVDQSLISLWHLARC